MKVALALFHADKIYTEGIFCENAFKNLEVFFNYRRNNIYFGLRVEKTSHCDSYLLKQPQFSEYANAHFPQI